MNAKQHDNSYRLIKARIDLGLYRPESRRTAYDVKPEVDERDRLYVGGVYIGRVYRDHE